MEEPTKTSSSEQAALHESLLMQEAQLPPELKDEISKKQLSQSMDRVGLEQSPPPNASF
jgi:hypothetical protein